MASPLRPQVPLRFRQVDVFTKVPFLGNPVAVVIGAEGMSSEAMQRIARWTNLSETTFLTKSDQADYAVRIFTPLAELPFAGHPTLGTAHAAMEANFINKKSFLKQECRAGIIDLSVEDGRIFLKGPPAKFSALKGAPGLKLLGEAARVDVGPVWLVGEVGDASALGAYRPDLPSIEKLSVENKATGLTLFAKSGDGVSAIHLRTFAPAHGIAEDPVCGSCNVAVAAFLRETGRLELIGSEYVARQGMQLGRDGRIYVRVEGDAVWVGGDCVTCVEGELKSGSGTDFRNA